jgi:hypothetical protein
MKIIKSKLLKENKNFILENVKQAKQYLDQGKLSDADFKTFTQITGLK